MKITDLETFVVGNPDQDFGGRYWFFVKLVTDDGIAGYGEVYAAAFSPSVVERMVRDVFERFVEGADPFRIEHMWRRVYSAGYSQRSELSLMSVLSGLETACWDVVGKSVDRPVYQLLGGKVHDRLRSYTYLYPAPGDPASVYRDPDVAARRAVEMVELGFTAVKFDPCGPYTAYDPRQLDPATMAHVEHFTATLRAAVGDRCDLLFGTHGQLTAAAAIRLARRLEPFDPLWFEEPVPPENMAEMARVARSTTIPIATGERLAGKYEFARLVETQAASILQMALGRVGGILEAKKIAAIAEAHYCQIAPHLYCGPIEAAANIQLDTCSPNFLIQESILDFSGFSARILKQPIRWEEGYIIPPDGPGIGVELDETVARANPWRGDELHLMVKDSPDDDGGWGSMVSV
ncbi:MAG: mandelate racemase/muconate lactonizing enzyme family protein [Proteobacteria bacterium]|nr:MAG: mandelate racemase/muconate lactonizing enzyme family protein [Pseudomonadota bacterium]